MNLDELKTGMFVLFRKGTKGIIKGNSIVTIDGNEEDEVLNLPNEYHNDLTYKFTKKDLVYDLTPEDFKRFDIVQVASDYEFRNLLWERDEDSFKVEHENLEYCLTIYEYEFLRALEYFGFFGRYKYVTKIGHFLRFFNTKADLYFGGGGRINLAHFKGLDFDNFKYNKNYDVEELLQANKDKLCDFDDDWEDVEINDEADWLDEETIDELKEEIKRGAEWI